MNSNNYQVYLDLDNTLVDFTTLATEALGTDDFDSLPIHTFWQKLIEFGDFFNKLNWLPDGKDLWNFSKKFKPIILSGVPRGTWAHKQKLTWCSRELGDDVSVILCFVKDKYREAIRCQEKLNLIPVLVDDRYETKESWEKAGGIFIHHTSAKKSIESLKELFTTNKA